MSLVVALIDSLLGNRHALQVALGRGHQSQALFAKLASSLTRIHSSRC